MLMSLFRQESHLDFFFNMLKKNKLKLIIFLELG